MKAIIVGPRNSGKSTFSKKLKQQCEGKPVLIIDEIPRNHVFHFPLPDHLILICQYLKDVPPAIRVYFDIYTYDPLFNQNNNERFVRL